VMGWLISLPAPVAPGRIDGLTLRLEATKKRTQKRNT
jgi:hypothetical protein